ncbi:glycine oxidase ThiO [Humibacter ginsengisoli]
MRATNGSEAVDVAVIGGGVIGLSIGWMLMQAGYSVRVIDPRPASGATFAAAGMLTPIGEYHYQEESLLELMLASASLYPRFIESVPGAEAAYLANGTLLVGLDRGDTQALADLHAALRQRDLVVEPLTRSGARLQEPFLGPRVSAAYRVAGDQQVDPRVLAQALAEGLSRGARAGIVRQRVVALVHADACDPVSPVVGVQLDDGTSIAAGEVVVANGVAASGLEGLAAAGMPLRPVYGDILRLRVPEHLRPLLTMTVRALVHGAPVYLVPRADGTVVLGATQREDGRSGVSAGAVHRLLSDAQEVLPAVAELDLIEATTRARPATPDNAPFLGRTGAGDGTDVPGLIIATGFFRHGVLLAPIAAEICLDLVRGSEDSRWSRFRPDRFGPRPAAFAPRTEQYAPRVKSFAQQERSTS